MELSSRAESRDLGFDLQLPDSPITQLPDGFVELSSRGAATRDPLLLVWRRATRPRTGLCKPGRVPPGPLLRNFIPPAAPAARSSGLLFHFPFPLFSNVHN